MDYIDYIKNKTQLNFWYRARLSLIENLLAQVLNKNSKATILDIGCGTGTELRVLEKYGKVVALDKNSKSLKIANKVCSQILQVDIEKESLGSREYDVICCFDVLEHLDNDSQALANIYKSLKKGGYLLFSVPAYQFLFSSHDYALGHVRRYSKKDIEEKIKLLNFSIYRLSYWNSLLFPVILTLRIVKKFYFKIKKKHKHQTETFKLRTFFDNLLFNVLNFESNLTQSKLKLPFGLTIYGIVRK